MRTAGEGFNDGAGLTLERLAAKDQQRDMERALRERQKEG